MGLPETVGKIKGKLRRIKRAIKLIAFRIRFFPRIMTEAQTICHIKKTHCSISRYGDGEFAIMFDGEIGFQPADPKLAQALKTVMASDDKKLLICIPHTFVQTFGYKKESADFWNGWVKGSGLRAFGLIDSLAGPHIRFGDTQTTRPYMDWKSSKNATIVFRLFKELWDNRDILVVEGTQTRLGVGNDLLSNARSVKRILCPAVNAFSVYDEILAGIRAVYDNELVLLALGPTATVLAYDLTKLGIQALDVGHLDVEYMWYLQGATQKCAIPGKYINEIPEARDRTSVCQDTLYCAQVILQIP